LLEYNTLKDYEILCDNWMGDTPSHK